MRNEQKERFFEMEKGRDYGEDLDVKITFKNPNSNDENSDEPEELKEIVRDVTLRGLAESTLKKKVKEEEIDFDRWER